MRLSLIEALSEKAKTQEQGDKTLICAGEAEQATFLHITSNQTWTHYREHFLPAAVITHLSILLSLSLRRQWRAYVAPVTKRKSLAPCHVDLITLLIMLICCCLQGHAQHDFLDKHNTYNIHIFSHIRSNAVNQSKAELMRRIPIYPY